MSQLQPDNDGELSQLGIWLIWHELTSQDINDKMARLIRMNRVEAAAYMFPLALLSWSMNRGMKAALGHCTRCFRAGSRHW